MYRARHLIRQWNPLQLFPHHLSRKQGFAAPDYARGRQIYQVQNCRRSRSIRAIYYAPFASLGPMVDNGAPYSYIGVSELWKLSSTIPPKFNIEICPIPLELSDFPFWKYGIYNHSSEIRRSLGSVVLPAVYPDELILHSSHLVPNGASNWADYCHWGKPPG